MKVGMIGLGKLGLPVATAMAARGLNVYGYDPCVRGFPEDTSHEEGLAEAIEQAGTRMHFVSLDEVTANCEVVFVAVQTPHGPEYEGITPLPETRADFDYSYLIQAVKHICGAAKGKPLTLSVISTVLPGTMKRYIEPLLPENVKLVYNPSFIAMGTTIRDFLDPEFVLLGGDQGPVGRVLGVYDAASVTRKRWDGASDRFTTVAQTVRTSIPNAELIKVSYNTFIGLKIAFANTIMEVCHKTDCDVDEVTGALKLAHRRLISPAYLDGGMGDGGACHPRDNIALSWLARELDLSHDIFEDAMVCREDQARWLADLMCEYDLPKGILGTAYKPGSRITTGSAAMLVVNLLLDRNHLPTAVEPVDNPGAEVGQFARVWLVGCKHPEFVDYKFASGSVVIDPFRYIPDQEGVEVIRLGSGSAPEQSPESSSTQIPRSGDQLRPVAPC